LPHKSNYYNKKWINEMVPDYCNNPSDIMPIAFENELSLCWDMFGKQYVCSVDPFGLTSKDKLDAYHKNPLRAAVIVLLLMEKNNG
jgi:hypothetical protein